jgi:hypothetical protein
MKLNKVVLKNVGLVLLCVWVFAKVWDFVGLAKYWSVQDFILIVGVILLIAGGITAEEEKEEHTYRVIK